MQASEKRMNVYNILFYKEIAQPGSKREFQFIGDYEFDGMQEVVFCSNDINEEQKYEQQPDKY